MDNELKPMAWMYTDTFSGQKFTSRHRRTHYDGNPVADETPLYAEPPRAQPDATINERAMQKTIDRLHRELEQMREKFVNALSAQPDAEVVAFVAAAKALRLGIREAGVKREPAIYERVMRFDAALAALENRDV